MSFASAEVKGRAGSTPQLRYTTSGTAVMNVGIAVSKIHNRDKANTTPVTEWFTVVCFGKFAERIHPLIQKGSLVWAKGELIQRKWQDKEGREREACEIRAISLEVCVPTPKNESVETEQDIPW